MGDNLNYIEEFKKIDKSNYLDFLTGFSNQLKEAANISIPDNGSNDISEINNIVISGMGGSAIAGDCFKSMYSDLLKMPVEVNRDYNVPAFTGKNTLFIASSYSGNTEETLSATKAAFDNGANIICITTGGKLKDFALKYKLNSIIIPPGFQPRAAIGYSLISLIRLAAESNLIKNADIDIQKSIKLITEMANIHSPENLIKSPSFSLAQDLKEKILLIYTPPAPFDVIGTRLRCQFAENTKVLAFSNVFPELNHNEIMGWAQSTPCIKHYHVLFIRDKDEHPQVTKRINITNEILRKFNVGCSEIISEGATVMERLFSLIYFGDYVSFYLAMINNTDPTPIENIMYLKDNLTK